MTAALAGTLQIRRRIGWVHVSSRIVHGVPHFMTVTPSEKHSGLCVRLMRYREGDPGLQTAHGTLFKPWIGSNVPSLCAPEGVVEIDLPEYDLRRAMTGKDPLCCFHAFWINVRVILSNLYGWRMCPECLIAQTDRIHVWISMKAMRRAWVVAAGVQMPLSERPEHRKQGACCICICMCFYKCCISIKPHLKSEQCFGNSLSP